MSQKIKTLEAEIAKAKNELGCAEGDIAKAQRRIAFCLSALHNLKNRDIEDKQI